jgi:hypothetical protein
MIELLVVIAMIGLMIALLFSAVRAAREAARRAQYSYNFKQLSMAVPASCDTYGAAFSPITTPNQRACDFHRQTQPLEDSAVCAGASTDPPAARVARALVGHRCPPPLGPRQQRQRHSPALSDR